jgi:hypothetical protein
VLAACTEVKNKKEKGSGGHRGCTLLLYQHDGGRGDASMEAPCGRGKGGRHCGWLASNNLGMVVTSDLRTVVTSGRWRRHAA